MRTQCANVALSNHLYKQIVRTNTPGQEIANMLSDCVGVGHGVILCIVMI